MRSMKELNNMQRMAYLQRSSPALKEILLKIYRADKPLEIDQHLYEFGSVEYHIKCSVSNPYNVYLSISTSLVSQGDGLWHSCMEMIIKKGIAHGVVDIVEPAKEGFQLTLRLNFDKIPNGKEALKTITKISEMQAMARSYQLKEMLRNVSTQDTSQVMNKPIKLVYHPREPFYVIKQHQKITMVFPMRFKDHSDVVIATAFFQELMDVASNKEMAKAPACSWSPIPPPELRGEPFHDLSTNGGFVSFDITSRHVKGKRLDKTVWNLLNFYAYVKYHIKCTRGFIQRKMRRRMESLVEVLNKTYLEEDAPIEKVRVNKRCKYVKKLVRISKAKMVRQRCRELATTVTKIGFRIKSNAYARFRQR